MRERNAMRQFHMGCGEPLRSPQLTTYFRATPEQVCKLPGKAEKKKARGKTKQ